MKLGGEHNWIINKCAFNKDMYHLHALWMARCVGYWFKAKEILVKDVMLIVVYVIADILLTKKYLEG